ncbi:hypothetical protein M409DRAFT_51789 [Zasmidium cellare ATCC 36951]|uniref:Pentacotripeptide-repeat region of PRORP domain-containing protein n=1 Tax=Zasmidium cellare ATCC 36951 TaxID=1080233 RepID=A0A6A6CS80_ZASCE|nr:uncharacterized protein M409DRAFT_51789 [Zasmidium cellare ATCC 36951]KAF2170014.1 hypothetical protein M409DRAFT_51789 [Zasmidium cellare ATCC 36951]
MQCHGALKRPLRSIIKSIGVNSNPPPSPRHGLSPDLARDHSRGTHSSQSTHRGDPRDGHQSRQPDEQWRLPHFEPGWFPGQGNHGLGRRALHTSKTPSQRRRPIRSPRHFHTDLGHGRDETSGAGTKRGESGEGDKARETPTDAQDQGLAHIEHDRDGSEAMTVRRVEGPVAPLHRPVYSNGKASTPFEDVVRAAEKRPIDGTYRVKSGDELKVRYFDAYRSGQQDRLRKSFHRWQIQKERHLHPSSDDWRKVLYLLEDATPSGEEHFKKTLEAVDLPLNASVRVKGNVGAAILDIMQRTGSHMQIGTGALHGNASRRNKDFLSSISLLGTAQENAAALRILPRYVEVVDPKGDGRTRNLGDLSLRSPDKSYWDEQDTLSEAEIERLENALDQVTDSTDRLTKPAMPVRAIWVVDRLKRDSSISPERLLQRPASWTTAKLTLYIERLTEKRPRLVMQRLSHHKKTASSHVGHINIVTEELKTLLTDEAAIKHLAASTLDRALQYLTKHSKYHVFRKIFNFLEHNGYEFVVSNWNVLLAAAARAGDVSNFSYILKLMIDRKVPPTPVTWALFHDLMSRRFPLEAGTVVEIMRRKGLLNHNKAASLIAANSATNDLTAHLAMKGDLDSFYRLYDNRFGLSYGQSGFEWLSINVVNRMSGVLLAAGKVHDAFTMLQEYQKRSRAKNQMAAPETSTLNIFLTSALRARNPATAIAILQRFRVSQPGAIAPDHITYSILFIIAWRQKHYNMLRVVWRYACAAGHVGYSMQTRIQSSMLWQPPKDLPLEETGAMKQLWMTFAAKFAAGLNGQQCLQSKGLADSEDRTAASPNFSDVDSTLVRLASQTYMALDSSEYHEYQKEADGVLRSDLSQVQKVAPVLPFADVLAEALRKDVEWWEKGIGGPRGVLAAGGIREMFTEMVQKGVQIPIMDGDYTKDARPWELPYILNDRRVNDRA